MDIDSMIHRYQVSYYKLPKSVKTFLGSLYGAVPLRIRFGHEYTQYKKSLDLFLESDMQYKLDFQFNKTVETLQFAKDHIPHYQNLFKEYGFDIGDFKDFSDLKKIPVLTKQMIQNKLDDLYTDVVDTPVAYYTGGSSATPMKIYAPLSSSRAKEKAYMNHAFLQANHHYRQRAVSLSARGNADEKNEIYWEYQKIDNYLLVSVNHLDIQHIEKIVAEIKAWKPKTFYGFPSAIALFIRSCRTIGIKTIEGISGVVLTSESVSWEDIDLIKSFFKATVVSHYGHTERVVSGVRKDKEGYEFYNSYGLVQSENGEIIGTSFDNFVMPYINYSTSDFMGKEEFFEGTNIVKSTSSIQGRMQESVVTKENIVIPLLSIGAGHFSSYDVVEKAQFYQDTPGKVVLRIQTKKPKDVQIKTMIDQMQKQVGGKIDFSIEFVDFIASTSRRKQILCIQKLDISQYKKMQQREDRK
jgi:phenylacetate-CoA ligase